VVGFFRITSIKTKNPVFSRKTGFFGIITFQKIYYKQLSDNLADNLAILGGNILP
jgi:hypothetical protein